MATPKQILDVILHLANKLLEYLNSRSVDVVAGMIVGLLTLLQTCWVCYPCCRHDGGCVTLVAGIIVGLLPLLQA